MTIPDPPEQDTAPRRTYWYQFHITECVLCGRANSWKERIYDKPKPTDPAARYVYRQDACGTHFC